MEDNQIDKLFAGELQNVPPWRQPLIRIYLSSTYTDMTLEKTELFAEVYPKLKEYCREKYGLEFQIIDMRWGVRDEATDDHSTTKICLEEIHNCQEMSLGPNFVFLGGQKYGFRPIPASIQCEEYQLLKKTLEDLGREVTDLEEWYQIDENSEPKVMVLQPITSKLPNFLNKLIPDEQEADQRKWWNILARLQDNLKYVSTYLFKTDKLSYEEMLNYHISVVERECNEGIVNVDSTKYSALAFLRKIEDINMSDNRGGEGRQPQCFVDLNKKQLDKASMELADKLREEIIPDHLEKSNFKKYTVEWSTITGHNPASYNQYLKSFMMDFYVGVVKLVDKAMKRMDTSVRGNMATEIHKHLHLCNVSAKKFLGREEELYKVKMYLLGTLRRPFLIYGQTGTGKSMFSAKVAMCLREWVENPSKLVLVVRFLGTTPTSSSIHSLVLSICQQICYNMEIPIEEIPEDFVPLKNYFKILLDRTSEKFFLVILLDAIEIFFVNSHQNGATSWIPRDLPPNVKVVITFTSNPDDDTEEKAKFLRGFSEGVTEENNLLHLGELGADLAEKVLKYWLESINRKLTNYQWRVAMNAMHTCSLALFLDLCFSLLRNWKSYDPPEVTVIPQSINAAILELFANVERKYGRILVSHAVSFITASKSGLSETELEDILCLDEQVLDEVFRFQLPLVRRIPPILWTKIRRDLKDHFTEHDADGSRVVVWAHKQFRDVAIQLYLTHESISVYLHGIMSDYFMGIWSGGRPKPFKYTELHRQRLKVSGRMGESDRKLPSQPNVFKGTDGKVSRYNMRKFAELPFHLIGSGRIVDLCDQVLFNYLWLHAKISAVPIDGILDDFTRALHIIKDPALKRQVLLVLGALKLSRTVLDKYPDMLAAHLIARLLPEIKHHMSLRSLIQQCDHDGFIHNCLVPLRHYLASPGGPLKYSLEGHNFAIFGCSLTNDKRYVVSISNRFISWDITTSEICRDIDPRSDGMILGLAVSSDDRYAAAFTSSNQLVIIDIMLGHYIKVEKPMEKMDDIVDITIIGKRVVVYNSKYWRAFDMSGQHLSSDNFSILLSDVLSMIFVSEDVFLSLHWSGDQDYDDTRIWIQPVVKGDKSEPVLVFNAFEMASFSQDRLIYFACQKADAAISSYNIDSPGSSRKWSIIRYEQDPRGNAKEKAAVICAETEDVFGLTLHNSQKSSCLSAAVSEGFLLIFQPLCGDSGQLGRQLKRLSLPRSVVNIRLKLNKSNPSIGIFDDAQMFIAGVRRDIFVWNWEKEQLLRSFAGHSGRILEMKALLSPSQRIFVSSSADKTIKVWDVDQLLEYVHPIDKMDLKIDKLVCCEKLKIVVSLTRGGLGFWNLETGALDYKLSDNAGGFVTDVVVASNGKYFVTAENNEKVLTWNLSSRVVLYKDNQADVHQLLLLEEISPHLILAVSSLKCNKTGCDLYRVVARSEGGKRVYKFDCQINREFPLIVTDDQHFLAILGFDRAKNKECVSVFHSKKGVFLHKVLLKYPHIKRPLKFEAFSESSCVIVDSEKGNIIDLRNKCFVRSIRNWTGQAIGEDYRYGLSAPNSGGLRYMDLKNGHVLHSVLENAAEGVFTIHAQFTRCGRYILYYHNSRKTVRLFTRPECKLVANFCLHSEATAFVSTADGNRLIIGGLDGTVTFLVVAHNSAEELENTRSMLTKLPSRRLHNQPPKANLAGSEDELEDFYSNSLTEELRQRRLKKQATLRRFRAVAKVALMMDRICRNVKASKKSKANRANVNTCPLS